MKPFTDYLPPHRPVCLCIGDNAPQLGETSLFLPGPPFEVFPLMMEAGCHYDLISIACDPMMPLMKALSDPSECAFDLMVRFLTSRGNLVLFERAGVLRPKERRDMWGFLECPTAGTAKFYAPNHHNGAPEITTKETWLTHRKGDYVDITNACPDTERRHRAVVEEYRRRANLGSDLANIRVADDGQLWLHAHEFQRFSHKIPLAQKHWVGLFAQRDMDRVMANPQDRAIFRSVVTNTAWHVSHDSAGLIQKAFAHHASQHAPLTQQTAHQRLAWLDEAAEVRTISGHSNKAFTNQQAYPLRTYWRDCMASTERPGTDGTAEEIRLTGRTLCAAVIDDMGVEHTFGNECPESWDDFIATFAPPDVKDIATINPNAYESHKHWLVRFAKYLTATIPPAA